MRKIFKKNVLAILLGITTAIFVLALMLYEDKPSVDFKDAFSGQELNKSICYYNDWVALDAFDDNVVYEDDEEIMYNDGQKTYGSLGEYVRNLRLVTKDKAFALQNGDRFFGSNDRNLIYINLLSKKKEMVPGGDKVRKFAQSGEQLLMIKQDVNEFTNSGEEGDGEEVLREDAVEKVKNFVDKNGEPLLLKARIHNLRTDKGKDIEIKRSNKAKFFTYDYALTTEKLYLVEGDIFAVVDLRNEKKKTIEIPKGLKESKESDLYIFPSDGEDKLYITYATWKQASPRSVYEYDTKAEKFTELLKMSLQDGPAYILNSAIYYSGTSPNEDYTDILIRYDLKTEKERIVWKKKGRYIDVFRPSGGTMYILTTDIELGNTKLEKVKI
ncbi:MAG: hypothetical protein ACRCUS_03760 [Anaerovoracaceae bacterium]